MVWSLEGAKWVERALAEFNDPVLVDVVGEPPVLSNKRLSIGETEALERSTYAYFGGEDRLRAVYNYLGWAQLKYEGRRIVVNGLLEHVSMMYSEILGKLEQGVLQQSDFREYTLAKVMMVLVRVGQCGAVLNESQVVLTRLSKVFLVRGGCDCVAALTAFDTSSMVSLADLLGNND